MKIPDVSIIIPTYNAEEYIEECINSCLLQKPNIEIIIIDDASDDITCDIIRKYQYIKNCRIILKNSNTGCGATRNIGISVAQGKYILFVDHDDFLDKGMIETMFENAVNSNAEIVTCNYNILEGTNTRYNVLDIKDEILCGKDLWKSFMLKYKPAPWNKLIKKDLIDKNNILFPINLFSASDQYFTIVASFFSKSISVISNSFYYYRVSNNSLSNKITQQHIYDCVKLVRMLEHFFLKQQVDDSYKSFLVEIKNSLLNRIIRIYEKGGENELIQQAKLLKNDIDLLN